VTEGEWNLLRGKAMKQEDHSGSLFRFERVPSPCGEMLVVTDPEDILCLLHWRADLEEIGRLLRRPHRDVRLQAREGASVVRRALEEYLAGDLHAIDSLPVNARGTAFQQEVWAALRRIPAGATLSYSGLAAQLNRPEAVRAVGLANGSNPIAVVVPCHRVIGADGSLTGYGGGLERKRWLLEHEGVNLSRPSTSKRKHSKAGSPQLSFLPAADR
jgi:methylated-DNA-[protein]-cysteine S-methyltransferase